MNAFIVGVCENPNPYLITPGQAGTDSFRRFWRDLSKFGLTAPGLIVSFADLRDILAAERRFGQAGGARKLKPPGLWMPFPLPPRHAVRPVPLSPAAAPASPPSHPLKQGTANRKSTQYAGIRRNTGFLRSPSVSIDSASEGVT